MLMQTIPIYCRKVSDIPLGFSHVYEVIDDYKPATKEVGGVNLEPCPAYATSPCR